MSQRILQVTGTGRGSPTFYIMLDMISYFYTDANPYICTVIVLNNGARLECEESVDVIAERIANAAKEPEA